MAGCGSKRKMAYGGKVKKMREGGMSKKDRELFGDTEMDQKPPKNFKKSKPDSDKKPVPKDNPGLKKLPTEVRNKMGYMKKGGKVKKGMHMMPDGTMMKDSDHKKKKMKSGGMVKRDGCAVRGKTKGRMV